MCVPARLWRQIARTPSNCTITVRTLLAKCYDYQFQRLILQFPAEGKKISYRKHVHHNASRCWAKRKWLYVLWDKPFSEVWTNRVESMKKYRWKYESTSLTIKFTHLTVEPTPFYPWVCLHNTGAVRNLISDVWRVLTWQHRQNQITASDLT